MLELRDYQIEGADFLFSRDAALLGDVMGAGKSAQIVEALKLRSPRVVLIISTKVIETVWEKQIEIWWPEKSNNVILFTGKPKQRLEAEAQIAKALQTTDWPIFILTHYELMKQIPTWIPFDVIVIDEAHKLRGRKMLWKEAKALRRRTNNFYLVTGTPIVKGPSDIISLLMLLDTKKFSHFWPIANKYFNIEKDPIMGYRSVGTCRRPEEFRSLLSQYMIRRTKDVIMPELPPKIRQELLLEMSPQQAKLYGTLVDQKMAELGDELLLLNATHLSQLTMFRQLLVDPRILGADFEGSATIMMKEWARDNKDIGASMVIFTPFRAAVINAANDLKTLNLKSSTLMGGMKFEDIKQSVDDFTTGKTQALICTIDVAEGFTAVVASRGFFLGSHWNPPVNEQAEDRMHRHGQEATVQIYYALYKDTIDMRLKDILNGKKFVEDQILLKDFFLGRG